MKKKLITYISELNDLLRIDKQQEARDKVKKLKQIFPQDEVPVIIEDLINNILQDNVVAQTIEYKEPYRVWFFIYILTRDKQDTTSLMIPKKSKINFQKFIENLRDKNQDVANFKDKLLIEEFSEFRIQFFFIGYLFAELASKDPTKINKTINTLLKDKYTLDEIYYALWNAWHNFKLDWLDGELDKFGGNTLMTLIREIYYSPLKSVKINNYFSLENVELNDLADKNEIYFLGENGIGKTILLQSILLALRGNTGNETIFSFIRENDEFIKRTNKENLELLAESKDGGKYNFEINYKDQKLNYEKVFAYGVNRLRKSDKEVDKEGYLSLFDGDVYLTNPVQWLKDVQLEYYNYKEKLKRNELTEKDIEPINPSHAQNLLEQVINFEAEEEKFTVLINGTDIRFKEKGTELKFEQLSDGYKNILILITDLLSRLAKVQPFIQDARYYRGIVLIDELDVYLHPRWEYSIVGLLRKLFPGIQWIFSTHSPVLILGASKDAVFYKLYKENGITKVDEPFSMKTFSNKLLSGFATSPLFNLPSAKPAAFQKSKFGFETGDYLYSIIHNEVKKQLHKKPLQTDEIKNMVNDLLNKFEKEGQI